VLWANGALSSSFRLDVGCLDHLGPFREFDLDVLGEFLGGARDRFEAKHSKPLPDVGQRHDLDDLVMKESYDLFWRPGRYDETLPVVARDIRIAELRRRGHIRQTLATASCSSPRGRAICPLSPAVQPATARRSISAYVPRPLNRLPSRRC